MKNIMLCILMYLSVSCKYVKRTKITESNCIDTIIDFEKVDLSPAFKACESSIDEERTYCFREHIQRYFAATLKAYKDTTNYHIDKKIILLIEIDTLGKTQLISIDNQQNLRDSLPKLLNKIKIAVNKIPKLLPAIKRGIPVNSIYKLPIHIQSSE